MGSWEKELDCGSYITLVDEAGKELDQLSRFVYVGDEIILEDNKHYKIVKVDDKQNKAIAELVGKADIVWREEWDQLPVTLLAQNKGESGDLYDPYCRVICASQTEQTVSPVMGAYYR